jgi:type II secretory pathway predicted ATPase ExeA
MTNKEIEKLMLYAIDLLKRFQNLTEESINNLRKIK